MQGDVNFVTTTEGLNSSSHRHFSPWQSGNDVVDISYAHHDHETLRHVSTNQEQ